MTRFLKHLMTLALSVCLFASCLDDIAPGSYYTFTGNTVASFLENNESEFSSFVKILKKAEIWGELRTYGNFTCFAPTNAAIDQFLESRGQTFDDLTKADCDTISWTHLIKATYFLKDVPEGSFPMVNMNDRYLMLSFDSTFTAEGAQRLRYCVNKNSHIIEGDDTVQNGVIHIVDNVISFGGDYIFDVVRDNPDVSLFAAALTLIGLEDSLKVWYDDTYFVGEDSVDNPVSIEVYEGGYYDVWWWEKRKTCFTFLLEPDSVYAKHGINNLNDLIAYAKEVYDKSYPEDAGKYDDDFTNRKNPLNRFVSYHILPFYCGYSNFNIRTDLIDTYFPGIIDPEDFFSTYADHTLIRINTAMKDRRNVYVNSLGAEGNGTKDWKGQKVRGARIYSPTEMGSINQEGRNGIFHYIDDIIAYSADVRDVVLNRRLRVDWTTISPEFLTSGARHRKGNSSQEGIAFKQPKGFHLYNEDCTFSVRSPHGSCYVYEANAIDIVGNFDFYIKLPPVPRDGTYELRISYRNAGSIAGVVQNFLSSGTPNAWQPLGIPTDLRLSAESNPNIGWISDEELGTDEKIRIIDKSMRNRGYMKSPAGFTTYEGTPHRDKEGLARRILTTDYFYAETDYYLRQKLVLDNPKSEMTIDYMEWVPKNVYDGDENKY